jgi:hypothetical protein
MTNSNFYDYFNYNMSKFSINSHKYILICINIGKLYMNLIFLIILLIKCLKIFI